MPITTTLAERKSGQGKGDVEKMRQEHTPEKGKDEPADSHTAEEHEAPAADHRQQVAAWRHEFQQLTAINGADGDAVKAWQEEHGVPPTGKIRAQTIAAARAAKKAEERKNAGKKTDMFEADGDIEEGAGGKLENPALMDNIAEGAEDMESHNPGKEGDLLKQTGKGVQQAAKGAKMIGLVGGSPWFKAAQAPHIIDLLRRGDVLEACKELATQFGKEKAVEALTFVAKKIGLGQVVEAVEKFGASEAGVALGAALSVGWALVKWTYEGFKQIHEAHARGDQDSRIAIYAGAFADGFLYGSGSGDRAGAVTREQKDAWRLGNADGAATAGATGEQAASIGKALLDKHGGAHGARQAVINELLKKAGFSGVTV
jgi:hypothetical protein